MPTPSVADRSAELAALAVSALKGEPARALILNDVRKPRLAVLADGIVTADRSERFEKLKRRLHHHGFPVVGEGVYDDVSVLVAEAGEHENLEAERLFEGTVLAIVGEVAVR